MFMVPDRSSSAHLDASHLQAALRRLLRPLVRLLLQRGVTFPALCEMLRGIYVDVAARDFALPDGGQTDSRVSLLTGVHRKEVHRLRGNAMPDGPVPASVSRTSLVLARWLAEAAYTDGRGQPRPLPRTARPGEPSFETLVASVTRDVRPRTVLDEWLDNGLASLGPDDVVTLRDSAFVPRGGDEQRMYYFGRNIHDHVAAAVANVTSEAPPFLERAVHYDGLSGEVARGLAQRSRELAMGALTDANRQAHAACDSDSGGLWRWNFGVYVYLEEAMPTPSATVASSREASL